MNISVHISSINKNTNLIIHVFIQNVPLISYVLYVGC